MEYDPNNPSDIAIQYALLTESLKELKDSKTEKGRVILDWASRHYVNATDAVKFLKTAPAKVQEKLKVGELEITVLEFANIHIQL